MFLTNLFWLLTSRARRHHRIARLQRHQGSPTAVRKTYTTTGRPLSVRIGRTRGGGPCTVTVVDTMLLCAAKTSLEQLGKDLGLQKVELPEGYSKDRMDLFLAERGTISLHTL